MIFVLEPENALFITPSPAGMIEPNPNPNPVYQEGLFTFTLTEGANIIDPTPVIAMAPPTTMSLASQPGITITPSTSPAVLSSVTSTSTSKEMMITRPANPTLPISTPTTTSETETEKKMDMDPTMTYNHTTLIVVFVLLGLSALAVGLWYFRRSRTRKMISNGLADLEASVQEKRLSSLSKRDNRRSWIKLNEEIEQSEKVNSPSLPFPPSVNHQVQNRFHNQDQHQVYDYNNNNSNTNPIEDNLSSSSYTLNRRNSTINHFPAPPSNIPQLPPLPPTPQPQTSSSPGQQSINENKNIFESSELEVEPEPEIGVATTTSLPASSSRSAVAIHAYPGRSLTGSGREISKIGEVETPDFTLSQEGSTSNSPKRQSLPYVLPVQEAERTPTFISLSQVNHEKKSPDYRSPTESLYVIYKRK
ncbi:hypothetical protein I302_109021 [Kwoniella bestiolae CBS 10118]|uniref:Uncharacterized protein n=1 Tax=Kwoniella bestiolae CBS 10118 TaxID=1296100 RepID=A0A1B9FUR7_9TREE|nr:hypothetical protein I302_08163 [Kwoniella bestiolae CBS 10118]OCF22513.1 hypothetical protein I302_08163 [Kwoniella bestiolae CBS 10118]